MIDYRKCTIDVNTFTIPEDQIIRSMEILSHLCHDKERKHIWIIYAGIQYKTNIRNKIEVAMLPET
jgi:hypothetical protein